METRRFILALALSFMVFLIYVRFFAPAPPPQQTPVEPAPASMEKKAVTAESRIDAASLRLAPASKGRDIVIETDLVRAVVNTTGGVITRWELKHFRAASKEETGMKALWKKITGPRKKTLQDEDQGNVELLQAPELADQRGVLYPLTLLPLNAALAPMAQGEYRSNREALRLDASRPKDTLVLTYAGPGGIVVEKRLTFSNDSYAVDMEISTRRLDGYSLSLGTDFGIEDKVSSAAEGRVGTAALLDGKLITEKLDKVSAEVQHAGVIEWFGHQDKYFTAVILSGGQGIITTTKKTAPKETGDLLTTDLLVKDQAAQRTFTLYAGPKNYALLLPQGRGLERLIDFGWFGILARPMFWLMNWFYSFIGNYGIAIILLTIVVRVLLFYPSLKSAKAMEEMKTIQPEMAELREKYKKDPQRMNQEIMKLYKEKKVNPLGGCLPMLLQFPFFIALYNVLSVSIELRQAPFISFWIKDLSVHDPFYILPVMMGLSMILTMKLTATTADPKQAKLFMYMNVAFIFLFAWLPAGLLLYITLSNLLSIVQQLYVRKLMATPAS
ncbi:MAG: hypothetical protein A2X56_05615 [Nitrospirae bacterium GWC2_57_13]|jgi:YidC/Oxa1 family membrane protein insertase|nr:MAG: hypothetical protein A2X56_05615 [Nitrospirae bacterium GWC2_57_13]HAS55553.1 hypothetical protein [Nitrospiraceae bacterium]